MNMNIDLKNINPKAVLAALARYRNLAVTLIVLALFGFTGYQISHIAGVQADQAYLTQQKNQRKTTSLKVNKNTIEQLKNLKSSGDTSIPVNVGKQNPFSLN